MPGPLIEPSPPLTDEAIGKDYPLFLDRLITFQEWLTLTFIPRAQDSPPVVAHPAALAAQSAAIGATALVPVTSPGLYRVNWWARIVQAAGVSSSLTVTIATTDGTVAVSIAGAAITGNTTATVQGQSVILRADAAAILTYSAAYVSVGAPVMKFDLEFAVEILTP